MNLSRRDFLKMSGLTLGASLLPPEPPDEAPRQVQGLGRAIRGLYIYDRPSLQAKSLSVIAGETVFNIYATVTSDDAHYNRTWYQVQQGFVYSGQVQPVRWELQDPTPGVPTAGFLGEVSVPSTVARKGPGPKYAAAYRFYFSTTHWVTAAEADSDGTIWYRLFDDRLHQFAWAKGEHIRHVDVRDLAPLSPGVVNKRIEVDLEKQVFRCLENDVKVLEVLCATGPYLRSENGQRVYSTPSGEWAISRKRPSRHMAGDDLASADFFDLPGVPWVSYFHWWGVSIHGTYWHNDYGRPRSHGCVNLTPEAARWVYRWTLPHAPITKQQIEGSGTQVIVY